LKNNKKLLKRVKNSKNIPGLHIGTRTPPVAHVRPQALDFSTFFYRLFGRSAAKGLLTPANSLAFPVPYRAHAHTYANLGYKFFLLPGWRRRAIRTPETPMTFPNV